MNINFRPRLTKGRHLQTVDEAGPFCLVEAVGFNVDAKVDDAHASVDTVLAAMARTLNDRMCAHYSHPIAEAAGLIEPDTAGICDACQARLWAVGERIAETGYAVAHWTEAERTALHVRLAVEAAEAAFKLVTRNTELWRVVGDALAAASACQTDPTPNNRAVARKAAERIDRGAVDDGNEPAAWAAHAAAHATRAAAALAGDTLDAFITTDFFANRRAVEAVTYALGATAGDPGRSMGVARRVLNAFGKATSQNETPGVSRADRAAAKDADRVDAGFAVIVYPDDSGAAAADAAEPQFAEAAYREAYAAAAELADEETAAEDMVDARNRAAYAEANAEERSGYYSAAAPCPERTTVDGIGYGCVKLGEHVEHNTALGAAWWTAPEEYAEAVAADQLDAAAAAELEAVKADADDAYAAAVERAEADEDIRKSIGELGAALAEGFAAKADEHRRQVAAWMEVPAWAITPVETPTEEYEVVNDFEDSELGDVVDEAIGDAAALDDDLQRAEAMLTAIAAAHRPVAAWTRRRHTGVSVDIEYQTDCCVSCRDANGQPVPSPCNTLVILNSYGEL